jgi:oxygen-independent coproporphyrinogen-3 oxidase
MGDVRRKQTPNVGEYLEAVAAGRQAYVEQETLDAATARREALMLGLRLRAGMDPGAYRTRFGVDLVESCGPALGELEQGGFLEWYGGRLRLADKALLVSNEVLVRLDLT